VSKLYAFRSSLHSTYPLCCQRQNRRPVSSTTCFENKGCQTSNKNHDVAHLMFGALLSAATEPALTSGISESLSGQSVFILHRL
jgi:hypothetical protein